MNMSKEGMINIGLSEEQFQVIDDCVTKAHEILTLLQVKATDNDGVVDGLDIDIIFDYIDKANQLLKLR